MICTRASRNVSTIRALKTDESRGAIIVEIAVTDALSQELIIRTTSPDEG
jgi:hypothetical protein